MFVQLLAVCLLFTVATSYPQSNNGGGRSNQECQKPGQFDEMRLALQWTPAICKDTKCAKSVNDFTIHGMWPSNNSGNDPEFCCARPFSSRDIQHMQSKLNRHWMSIHGDDVSSRLWSHEWRKHGSCGLSSPALRDQKDYFEKTVGALENMPLLDWLKQANIVPRPLNENTLYSLTNVHSAIESKTGTKVYIDCTRLQNERIPLLSGVFICMDPRTLKLVDCQRTDYRRCGGRDVKFVTN